MANEIAELIKKARKDAGLSQFELANASGLSLRVIGKAESTAGDDMIKLSSFRRLFSHLASERSEWQKWLAAYLRQIEREYSEPPELAGGRKEVEDLNVAALRTMSKQDLAALERALNHLKKAS